MSVQSLEEMGKGFCPNFIQPFLENIDRKRPNGGSWEMIPVFHKPHRKGRPFTLEYLVGVLSKTASSGRKKVDVSDGTDVLRHSGSSCLAVWPNADACPYA